jgi:ribulose-phosphate 3-epimerase
VDRYADAGATYLTIHVEASHDVPGALAAIRARGVRPGLTLNPETPVGAVLPYLRMLDLALVMSVHPGFGGQKFIEGAIDKVRAIREALDGQKLTAELEVDGGVKPDNAARIVDAGATVLVAGSAVFEDPDGPVAALRKFKQAIRR